MFSNKNRKKIKNSPRVIGITLATMAVLLFFVLDLLSVQVVHGEEYVAAMKSLNKYNVPIEASRGEILDTNGYPLVTNRTGYSLIFDLSYFPSSSSTGQAKRNEIILSLINLLESKNEEWIDNLPLQFNEKGDISFPDGRNNDIAYLRSSEELNHYATAQNCFDSLVSRYKLTEYSKEDARKIASVCYSMRKMGFSMSSPYTFARDVSIETAAKIKENNDFYSGVDVSVVTYREYTDGSLAVHLLGNVGGISESEYERKKTALEEALNNPKLSQEEKNTLLADAYNLNDIIGKFGIEQAMEQYLRGKPGTKEITVDVNGNISSKYTLTPKAGNTVILTLDTELQRVTQRALEKRIKELTGGHGLVAAGACVVIDVNSGAILASASYPSYDLNTYTDDYSELASSDGAPLWNRALQSSYAPGSTMKPVIAVAALEEGAIDAGTSFLCEKEYKYGFSCLQYHGYLNVASAIDESCNVFFYRVSEILGINKMNHYSAAFGLGSKTGVELSEAGGVLASIAYSSSIGREWNPGDTIQASIGQSYNLFTPLQLANYCAAIANGGTRYVPHIIKSVKSYDYSETIIEKEAIVAENTGVSKQTLDIVREGMRRVVATGFCRDFFKDLPIAAAAKTGTSQTERLVDGEVVKGNNGFLISFAPYENAEIAVAVVIENVDSGTAVSKVAADIYDYYFNRTLEMKLVESVNDLLR